MKDLKMTTAGDYAREAEVVIPVKLSHDQIVMLALDVVQYSQDNPELRLGQAFCNLYKQKYSEDLHYPELYYTNSDNIVELTEAFLIKKYPVRKT